MAELARLEGIHLRSLEGRAIFDALDWSIPFGAQYRLLGPAGSGAPELLRLLAGIQHPDRGQVILDGVPVDSQALSHPFIQRGKLGWVPSNGGLLVNQTLTVNLALPLAFVQGVPSSKAETMAMEAMVSAGIGPLAQLRPHAMELSQRWLAGLVRASLMRAELWLVEAPPGDLDARTRKRARRVLDQAVEANATLIVLGEGAWSPDTLQAWQLEDGRIAPWEEP